MWKSHIVDDYETDCPMCGVKMYFSNKELPFEDKCDECNYSFTFVYKKIRNVEDETYYVDNPSYDAQYRRWEKKQPSDFSLTGLLVGKDWSSQPSSTKEKTRKRVFYTDGIKATRPKPPRVSAKSTGREPIPQDLMDAVWNRDGGKCVRCDSEEDLEFDHMIPVSKGGANTYNNIQILCRKCNRSKADNIGTQNKLI
tara:strand:+ start:129 stop:719 length:591 start_codon:yes stop_codon:yes gene_type:complete